MNLNFENDIRRMVEGVLNEVKESTSGIFGDMTGDFPKRDNFYNSCRINGKEINGRTEFAEMMKQIRKGLSDISEEINQNPEKNMSFEKRMENLERKLDNMSEEEKIANYKDILDDIKNALNDIKVNIPEYDSDKEQEEQEEKEEDSEKPLTLEEFIESIENEDIDDEDFYDDEDEDDDEEDFDDDYDDDEDEEEEIDEFLKPRYEGGFLHNLKKQLEKMAEEEEKEEREKNQKPRAKTVYINNYSKRSKNCKDTSDRAKEGLNNLGNKNTVYATDYAPEVLETFDNKHPDRDYFVKFNCPEFTSLCPITSQPDFATIYISYIPDKKMVESKSLKLYLFSFRNHGDFHEDCVNIIMNDLIKLMNPKYIEVWGKFLPRGGISIDPYCNYGRPDTKWEKLAWERLSHHDLYPEKIDNR